MLDIDAQAIVTLTVEVRVPHTWGPSCDVAEVYQQATASAVEELNKAFATSKLKMRVRGNAKVTARIFTHAEG